MTISRLLHSTVRLSLLSVAFGAFSPIDAWSQESSTAYNFLNLPSSTLTYGLGGINITSIEDDINSIDQNPSLLGPEVEMQLGVNYMRYIGESKDRKSVV